MNGTPGVRPLFVPHAGEHPRDRHASTKSAASIGWLNRKPSIRSPYCLATQRLIHECLAAQLVGYGTNGVPNQPDFDYVITLSK